MAKSGTKFRKPRKSPRRLHFVDRYKLAVAVMNGMKLQAVADQWKVSLGQVHRIKHEFLIEVIVWKPGVIRKLSERDLFGVVPPYPDEE